LEDKQKKTRKQIEKAKMVTVTTSTKPLVAKMTTVGIEENLSHLVLKKRISKRHFVIRLRSQT